MRPGHNGQPSDPTQAPTSSGIGSLEPSSWLGSIASVLNSSTINFSLADHAIDRLADATESGVGINAINYSSQEFRSQPLSLGLRGKYRQYTSFFGWLTRRARVEYQHRVEGDSQGSLAYADTLGMRYTLDMPAVRANAMRLGLGSALALRNGMTLDLGYERQYVAGQESSQAILLQVSIELGAKRP